MMIEKLYTVEEVAELASVTGRTIRNYLKSGRLVGRKIGGQWRFPENEVQRLLTGATADSVSQGDASEQYWEAESPGQASEPVAEERPSSYNVGGTYSEPAPEPRPVYADEAVRQPAPGAPVYHAEPAPLPQTAAPADAGGTAAPALSAAVVPPAPPVQASQQPLVSPAYAPAAAPPPPASGQAFASADAFPEYPAAGSPYGAPQPAYPSSPVPGAYGAPPQEGVYPQGMPYYNTPVASMAPPAGFASYYPPQSAAAAAPVQAGIAGAMPVGPQEPPAAGQAGPGAFPQASSEFLQGTFQGIQTPQGTFFVPVPSGAAAQPVPQPMPEINSDALGDDARQTAPSGAKGDFETLTDTERDLSASRQKAPEISDVGKKVLKYIEEVHDCSHGPQVCTIIDLHQSLSAAKITSERLANIAEQEFENDHYCRYYIEYDERFLVARYTLFGSSTFLLQCLKLLG